MVYTVERFVSRLDQLTPHKLDARKAVSSARSRAARYMCATFILRKYGYAGCAPPAVRASPGSNRSKQRPGHCVPREPRPRCAYVCACAHAHVSLNSQLVMCLSILREIIASGHAQNLSKKYGGGTAGHRHRCLGERADCRETAEREQTIYALLYRGRAALTPLGPIPLEALEERGPRVCAALLAAHRARRLARAGGDALGVARHHRVELLGGARE